MARNPEPRQRTQTLRRERVERCTPIEGEMGGTQTHTTTAETRGTDAPEGAARPGARGRVPRLVLGRTPNEHALMAEFLLAAGIVGLRSLADYVPADDASQPGAEKPARGAHPLTMLAALMAVFFVLALAAQSRSWIARGAIIFGALLDLTLLINSADEMQTVSGWFSAMSPHSDEQNA